MSEFQQQALSLALAQTAAPALSAVRERGAARLRTARWPDRRTERWKYTPLAALERTDFSAADSTARAANDAPMIDLDAYRLVFINGQFQADVSSELPSQLTHFSTADAEQTQLIAQHLGRLAASDEHVFAAVNEATLCDGVLLHLADDVALDKPVYVVHLADETTPSIASARLLVLLGKHARATIIEHFATVNAEQRGFLSAQTEIILNEGAHCEHYRLHLEDEQVSRVGGVYVELLHNSQFNGFTLSKGAALLRTDYGIFHRGEGAHAELQGLYLPRNKQLVDYHTNVQHCVPHCTTNEIFRGIIGDSAKAVFNGRIHIHPDAQKTLAQLSNKNLLTSNKAEIDTKPELEIYADDVRCAHGATVAQIDEQALYYLQSRGINRQQAQVMLSFGFVNELIANLSNRDVANYLLPELTAQFGLEALVFDEDEAALDSL
ncbi:MAG TPA: Fe-S cluster assembly protein SufD [Cellvibrionaceae bacterium]